MVGREVELARRRDASAAPVGEVVLEVEGLWAAATAASTPLRDVTLDVRAGEIVGVAGVAGTASASSPRRSPGMRPLTAGVDRGRRPARSAAAIRARRSAPGVAHVPEDRLHTGVAPSLSIAVERRRSSPTAAATSRAGRSCASADPRARRSS